MWIRLRVWLHRPIHGHTPDYYMNPGGFLIRCRRCETDATKRNDARLRRHRKLAARQHDSPPAGPS